MRILVYLTIVVLMIVTGCICCRGDHGTPITTLSLLEEMTDLNRLTLMSDRNYRTVQYSSYDRNSKKPGEHGWFSNSDGFGGEEVPGFEEVLIEPDASGTGEYLICDIQQPGAILRLWTAGINGKIRLYLDNIRKPVFEGNAQEFFWNLIESISDTNTHTFNASAFRQSDAVYFPVAFKRRCRIEWIGNVKDIHFYHVTVRLYPDGTPVRTFKSGDLNNDKLNEIAGQLYQVKAAGTNLQDVKLHLKKGGKEQLFEANGPRAVEILKIKLGRVNSEAMLRKCILAISFDNSASPQIIAPIGDFFGSAPGWAPYHSMPFSILNDSTMICRFVMPFRDHMKIEIENRSEADILVEAGIGLAEYDWNEGRSMHFNATWSIDHGLTASDSLITDIPYLKAYGKGRLVGAAAFLYNPSNVPTSWGNWWGEGDEKIFVDNDTFPSIFGTGTEDYFNYSWSSDRLFSSPYCGQTRNDGPGNRGYVSNYRWHITDDITFSEKIDFSVELWHHGKVPDFSYGRITYFYALPGSNSNNTLITPEQIAEVPYLAWKPTPYLGSSGFTFIQAEELIPIANRISLQKDKICSGGSVITWKPSKDKESIKFNFQNNSDTIPSNIGFTFVSGPPGGDLAFYLNGNLLKFDGREYITLNSEHTRMLRTYFSEKVSLNPGLNEITLESRSTDDNNQIGIDFIWLK